ncbi:DUF397 domain-containing protein [Saccharopolyspora terrae]|uniref:DUF397 domain-containing protein n=1 Tax=Saccharopolyspora terrae TaxID=2530384 RepID=A0A4R4V2B0_9PSEU|nr:DUF397 domain-containing protein [Saccharopolyspora terrae]TDC98821.1 DUF397 domain-containing protein [Saccharopolyspora terrae]
MPPENGPQPNTFERSRWRKTSTEGACVEVNHGTEGWVAVRDSKNPDGCILLFKRTVWSSFLVGIHTNRFDVRREQEGL